jgi:L-alanine-DL-glutamate epimerase-like enolase superfamily enzyme
MTTAPRLRVLAVDLFESPYRLRMPFRFGVITVTEGVQAIVRVRVRHENGREAFGYAAEALAAKWFDKDPRWSDAQNRDQLRRALELARDAYLPAPPSSAFGLYADAYADLLAAGTAMQMPHLVTSYGPALLDRAVLDAMCRIEGLSFWDAMRRNLSGIGPHAIVPDLEGFGMTPFLRGLEPLQALHVRHTVGLLDPIVAADQAPGSRVDDGLPETLEEVVARYGNRYFKLKVSGRMEADLDRLCRIASVLDRIQDAIHVTLDGNEQYADADAAAALWEAMAGEPALRRLCASTLLVEQPIGRATALSAAVTPLARHKPVIIDESDGDLDAFPRARRLGYRGVSSKACKGFYKSILNLARCRLWNAQAGEGCFMSAEDLTTQAGLSVQQDLALVGLLGIDHVERNAHHFIDGFDGRPMGEADAFLQAHPDLYHRENGRARLRIASGKVAIGSLGCRGFGASTDMDLSDTPAMPPAQWPPSAREEKAP